MAWRGEKGVEADVEEAAVNNLEAADDFDELDFDALNFDDLEAREEDFFEDDVPFLDEAINEDKFKPGSESTIFATAWARDQSPFSKGCASASPSLLDIFVNNNGGGEFSCSGNGTGLRRVLRLTADVFGGGGRRRFGGIAV